MGTFRTLTASDVELRVSQAGFNKKGQPWAIMLVYKNARVDRAILDDTFGMFGWGSSYELIDGKLFCSIKIKDPDTNEWIAKQDVGTESNTEKEKGQASDAFKRAAFAWGIGVELYSAPKNMAIYLRDGEYTSSEYNGKQVCKPYSGLFKVSCLQVSERTRKITYIEVVDRNGEIRFSDGTRRVRPTDKQLCQAAERMMKGEDVEARLEDAFIMTAEDWNKLNTIYDFQLKQTNTK